jgi:cytochrome c peroxidase
MKLNRRVSRVPGACVRAWVLPLAGAWLACGPLHAAAQFDEPLAPLPLNQPLDAGRVALGARLFNDTRFAADNSISCATCHDLARGGADTRPDSRVFSHATGTRVHIVNTPTVFNAALNFRQQWTGGADTLEDIVDKVVGSQHVFSSSWPRVLEKLKADAALAARFGDVYPGQGLGHETARDALAEFMRSLATPSRFDRYLRGDAGAITPDERRGYERFKAYGCVGCHQGVGVGGNMFQRFGAMNDYFAGLAKAGVTLTEGDNGRYNVTRREEDRHVFKVPGLRNVALTAPYFHNGSAATLEDAVDVMFRFQLGRTAPAQDKALIVKFLGSLTGEQFKE